MTAQLVIGDYNKSSWSLRAWLVLVTAGVPFEVIQVALEQPHSREQILRYSPSGKVPVLLDEGLVINDSLAICEYIASRHPEVPLWPADPRVKAMAWAAVAQMHSGFEHLRTQLSFGLSTGDSAPALTVATEVEIQRIFTLWRQLRASSGSSAFLCGAFGIVDAMYAPVVFRLRRFGIPIPADLQDYSAQILDYAPIGRWLALASTEHGGSHVQS